MLYAYDPPPPASTALLDCSYGDYDGPLAACWRKLEPFVERGPLLLPVPANGRGPEIALELLRHGRTDIFVDDAMQKALLELDDGAGISLRADAGDDVKRLASTVKPIDGARGIMLAGSADGTSGATARLFRDWERVRAGHPVHRLCEPDNAGGPAGQKRPRANDALECAPAALRHGGAGAGVASQDRHPGFLRQFAACRACRGARTGVRNHEWPDRAMS